MDKTILDTLHDSVARELLDRVRSGQATSAELSVATKFLKDNGAVHDVVTTESPMGNLLEALPFTPEASH